MTAPDVALLPGIADFFGVSIDELFDFDAAARAEHAHTICRDAAALRSSDPAAAEAMLRDGLADFPAHEEMLTLLLYVLLAMPNRNVDILAVCQQLLEHGKNGGVRIDVLRIMAQTYHDMGQLEMMEPLLEKIPEFYFSKKGCMARLLDGEKSREAARFQLQISIREAVDMLRILAQHAETDSNAEEAAAYCRAAETIHTAVDNL